MGASTHYVLTSQWRENLPHTHHCNTRTSLSTWTYINNMVCTNVLLLLRSEAQCVLKYCY